MTWFKVDDGLADHPKARRAGLAAMGLWVVGGSWAGRNGTDGFVPEWFVTSWPNGRRSAAALVEAGLWSPGTQAGINGWQFHQWSERQPTFDELRERRDKRAAAGRQGGIASGISRSKREASASPVASTVVEARRNPEPEPEPEPLTTSAPTVVGAPRRRSTNNGQERREDKLWDAVLDACHIDPETITASARGSYNKAVGDLRAVEATPGQARVKARRLEQKWGRDKLTPSSLAKHWAELDAGAAQRDVYHEG